MSKYVDNIKILERLGCKTSHESVIGSNEPALSAEIRRLTNNRESLVDAVKAAYRKHHMDDNSVGWDELSIKLHDALCRELGDGGFCTWVDSIEPMP